MDVSRGSIGIGRITLCVVIVTGDEESWNGDNPITTSVWKK